MVSNHNLVAIVAFVAAAFLFAIGVDLAAKSHAAGAERWETTYECPICDRIERFSEDGAKIHHCEGSGDKKHRKVVMTYKGKKKVSDSK